MKNTNTISSLKSACTKSINYLEFVEKILELSKDMPIDSTLFSKCAPFSIPLSKELNLSEMQTILLAIFIDNFDDSSIDAREFTRHFSCGKISILKLQKDFEALVDKGYIKRYYRRHRNDMQNTYTMNPKALESIQKNKPYIYKAVQIITENDFFEFLFNTFDDSECEFDFNTISTELKSAVKKNQNIHICQKIKELNIIEHEEESQSLSLLLFFCHQLYNNNDPVIGGRDLEWLGRSLEKRVYSRIRSKKDPLIKMGLIEHKRGGSFFDREGYSLTRKAIKELLPNHQLAEQQDPFEKALLQHKTLAAKTLFYNQKEEAEISQLSSLLEEKNFKRIQKDLEKKKMRKGFACLLHGSPGTGKTETVYQLAKQTGRDIYQVNVSQIKSMWVGESEKNIKLLFDTYRMLTQSQKRVPILLFNEADAILGARMEGAQCSVDKMENALQNIILQEMENLDGIMIATTNLTQNLDPAFERRFLYKIDFQKPCKEAKRAIWQSMLPDLAENDARSLAEKYDFSGGQIENIARKHAIQTILSGKAPTLEMLHFYCKGESVNNIEVETKTIGFTK